MGRSQWLFGVTEAQGLEGWKGMGDRGVHGAGGRATGGVGAAGGTPGREAQGDRMKVGEGLPLSCEAQLTL